MPEANAPCLLDAKQMDVHLQRLCREIVAAFGDDESAPGACTWPSAWRPC